MTKPTRKNSSVKDPKGADLRRQHNSDLIRRMRNGEPLNAIDSKASWYPPRPVIKKDSRELARLYGRSESTSKVKAAPTATIEPHNAQVVELTPPAAVGPRDEAG